jgi:hypothetical protein
MADLRLRAQARPAEARLDMFLAATGAAISPFRGANTCTEGQYIFVS